MTKEEIIRMALEAGGYIAELPNGDAWLFNDNQKIEHFFNLAFSAGAVSEREACAKVCDDIENEAYETYRQKYDTYTEGLADGANACLEAIRERK